MTPSPPDDLGTIRTHLALERTALAYGRTTLGLLVAAGTILELLPDHPHYTTIAAMCAVAALLTFTVGVWRIGSVRAKLQRTRP